jgi:hypothetical protein
MGLQHGGFKRVCNYQPKVKAPGEEVLQREKSRERDTDNFHFAEQGKCEIPLYRLWRSDARKLLTPRATCGPDAHVHRDIIIIFLLFISRSGLLLLVRAQSRLLDANDAPR